jgi:acyl dehydratase
MSDVFVNTPHNAAFIERYVTDWTGPLGRLAKLRFRMLRPAYPGDVVEMRGRVTAVVPLLADCAWVDIAIESEVDGEIGLSGAVRVAVPRSAEGNPWSIGSSSWEPEFGAVVID